MLIQFEDIMEDLFEREGKYVDHPSDRGGPTNLGITIHTMRRLSMDLDGDGDVDEHDVAALTREDAKEVYYKEFWIKPRCHEMPDNLKHIYFDMCVNFGPGGAAKVMQETANARYAVPIRKGTKAPLTVDGAMGPMTLSRMKVVEPERVRAYRVLRFARIVEGNPSQNAFWYGWFRRAIAV